MHLPFIMILDVFVRLRLALETSAAAQLMDVIASLVPRIGHDGNNLNHLSLTLLAFDLSHLDWLTRVFFHGHDHITNQHDVCHERRECSSVSRTS